MKFGRRRLFFISGFESSGSVFTARTVSHVVGRCASFGDWNGYGWNGKVGDRIVVAHRSLPFKRPRKWLDELKDEISPFSGYEKRFVICTRDVSISEISRQRRFGGTPEDYKQDTTRAKAEFGRIIDTHPCFIFSLESAVLLGEHYYRLFYDWLGVKSTFSPPIFDANAPYVGQTERNEKSSE